MKLDKLTHSELTGNFYFVKVGEILETGTIRNTARSERSEKVDVTKAVKQIVIKAMIHNSFGLCAFCNRPARDKWNIETWLNDINILTCENCQVERIEN